MRNQGDGSTRMCLHKGIGERAPRVIAPGVVAAGPRGAKAGYSGAAGAARGASQPDREEPADAEH